MQTHSLFYNMMRIIMLEGKVVSRSLFMVIETAYEVKQFDINKRTHAVRPYDKIQSCLADMKFSVGRPFIRFLLRRNEDEILRFAQNDDAP